MVLFLNQPVASSFRAVKRLRMLSRTPALRAAQTKTPGLLRSSTDLLHASSRQLLSSAPTATNRRLSTITTNGTRSLTSVRLHRIPTRQGSRNIVNGQRHVSSATQEPDSKAEPNDAVYELIEKINTTEAEILELLDELDLTDAYAGAGAAHDENVDEATREFPEHAEGQTPEERVQLARQLFGDTLPDGYLDQEDTLLYTRLYGEPIVVPEEAEPEQEPEADQLFREDGAGGWEEVEYERAQTRDDGETVYDMEAVQEEETDAMRRTREVAEQLGAEVMLDPLGNEDAEDSVPRFHPLTTQGKFATDPKTVFPPKDTLTTPISAILSEASNKHIAQAAHDVFGGEGLPQSTTTLPSRKKDPKKPIGLSSSQRFMSEMEANAYVAVLYPAMYASTLSVLTEIRKRLGSEWLRSLMTQEDGPNVLDAGAGGAGILAWRDVLRAEYEVMVPDHPTSDPYPLGRSTVLTGSDSLRHRASVMLENTTFLPRLPDYLHTREGPTLHDTRQPKRKQFDVIIAPHALMQFEEDYERKEYVENLWQLLNPNGGVLVLMEKGHQRGFETIAGARDMLLKRHIASPGSTEYDDLTESSAENPKVQKEPGMIIAPCTNHEKCPMYLTDGHNQGRQDYCHFTQRYIRPSFHQRIIGAKDRNHEDLKFSYVAVQRGIDLRQRDGIIQGTKATDAAFEGYEYLGGSAKSPAAETGEANSTEAKPNEAENAETRSTKAESSDSVFDLNTSHPDQKFNSLSLPRLMYTPMKRRGHVILDMCTPAGKIERWIVPRSFSRQAYKDARKAQWGDLWALGAKTRMLRNLRLGSKEGESKKERLERRAAKKLEEQEDLDFEDPNRPAAPTPLEFPGRKKGEKKVPSWKKYRDMKKNRLASKQQVRNI